MAPPTISARSVAMATNSAWTHSPSTTGRRYCFRQFSGRLAPVARPSFADRLCTNIAMMFAATITQSSR